MERKGILTFFFNFKELIIISTNKKIQTWISKLTSSIDEWLNEHSAKQFWQDSHTPDNGHRRPKHIIVRLAVYETENKRYI
jgi:hypothetical protein